MQRTTSSGGGEARGHYSSRASGRETRAAKPPDDSELAPVGPAPSVRDVVRPAEATPGGLDNVPVETMSDTDQLQDELDHARLDQDMTDLQ